MWPITENAIDIYSTKNEVNMHREVDGKGQKPSSLIHHNADIVVDGDCSTLTRSPIDNCENKQEVAQ